MIVLRSTCGVWPQEYSDDEVNSYEAPLEEYCFQLSLQGFETTTGSFDSLHFRGRSALRRSVETSCSFIVSGTGIVSDGDIAASVISKGS